jgi:multiple sugar transport system permease protein
MQPRTRFGKTLAAVLLLGGSMMFLFPFVWMLSTSLKPIEQTTSMPPQWVPHDYYAELQGRVRQVVRGDPLTVPMLVIRLEEGLRAGEQELVGVNEYDPASGRVQLMVGGAAQSFAATLVHRAEPGWYYIKERIATEAIDAPADWDVVPAEHIEARPRLFIENYPTAIRRMGLVNVWIPLVGERTIPIFWLYLRNTLIVCTLGVIGTLISCSLVAYSLAKIPWRGRGVLFGITLATMMVPFPVLMVPLYGLFKEFGWIGTLLPLWVPAFFGGGFNIFLLRQFFLTIPRELSEAARIDGCSEFGILWRIILPLSKPALAVVALFHFLFAWNDFIGPLLYLTRRETFTLSLGLQAYQAQHGGTDWTSLMAASTLVCLPIIVLFFFTQKTFIKGIATTGIKG